MDVALQLIINTLIAGAVNALLGVGLALVYAPTRVLHLAHGAAVLAAGYVMFELTARGLTTWVAVPTAMMAALTFGLVCEVVVYRPMRQRGATGLALLLASIALLTIGTNAILIRYSALTLRPHIPFTNAPIIIGGAAITPLQLGILLLAVILFFGLGALLAWTRIGVAIRAVSDHFTVSRIVGIPVEHTQRIAVALASLIGGIGGILLSYEYNLTPELATLYAVKAFTATIIGGAGSIVGAIVGGLALSAVQQLGAYVVGNGWQDAIAYGLVFIFLVARPQGILGHRS